MSAKVMSVVSVMLFYVSVHLTTLNALHSTLWFNHSLSLLYMVEH